MNLSWDDILANAIKFSKKWSMREGKEKQQAQMFIKDFLACFGIDDPLTIGEYEHPCPKQFGEDGYIDYFAPSRIIVEMKTKGRNLDKAFSQIKDYVFHLPADEIPDLVMVSDFDNIILYHRTTGKRLPFKTKDLRKHIKRFANIAGYETTRTYENQIEVNIKAAEKMAKLHDALKAHGYEGHILEVYLVRILFCLFADDTGIFPADSFRNYVENSKADGSDLSARLAYLFDILNTPNEVRAKRNLLSPELLQFRYINGGLFAEPLPFADFDAKMRNILLDCCNFNWNKISPAIFGAMFQGVMDKSKRRELGAHYTSEENILKLIRPLFLDELWKEFEHVKTDPQLLDRFHEKISQLKFLDPACGCGNFLIITYRELRILELEILKMKVNTNQMAIDISHLLKVNVEQFYGIEYEDFPCQIAQVGMWLIDHQMNMRVANLYGMNYARLPLKQSATIVNKNALRIDWESVVPKEKLNYILGNPPFVGFSMMTAAQKEDMKLIFPGTKNLDYVTCWYMKAAEFIVGTRIECAFLSTNSICQGEVIPVLWPKLFGKGIAINFAHRTFTWSNEAKGKAAVHCIIIGFANFRRQHRYIFDAEGVSEADNINPYLIDFDNVIVYAQRKPFGNIPEMIYGNKPADGGHLIIEESEYEDFLAKEPNARKFIKQYVGAAEFLHNKKRYCLWLQNASPTELNAMPHVMERIKKCREARLASISPEIRKFADTPSLFAQITQPAGKPYIIVPAHSSSERRYVPIGFMSPEIIASNAVFIIPNASLYHFGVLMSNVHNAWMRVTCGRIKSDYRYSKEIVYNAFPWPDPTDEQKAMIEECAQKVLDARNLYPDSCLADLYNPLTMKKELLKAHYNLDRAVMNAYGYNKDTTEARCIADLMQRYRKLAASQNQKK